MFSIVMPAYNEEKNIEEAIKSILNQSYYNIEIIVVDDGSTDNTWEILKNLSNEDQRLKVFSPGKLGKNGATNYAKERVCGEWFSFFGADDIMEPGILEKWNKIACKHNPEEEEVVISSRIRMFSDGNRYKKFDGIEIPKNKNDVCRSGAAFLASKKVMNNLFPLPLDFPNEDGWMMLYFKYLVDEFIACPEICINYRIHTGNSLDKRASYKVFNEQFHKRAIVKKTFMECYSERLTDKQMEIIGTGYKGELLRYNGELIKIILMKNLSFGHKMRLILLSKPYLYQIKLCLNRFIMGRTS